VRWSTTDDPVFGASFDEDAGCSDVEREDPDALRGGNARRPKAESDYER